jgi:hypothetical protein
MSPKQRFLGLALVLLAIAAIKLVAGSAYPAWQGGRGTQLSDPRWKVVREREKLDKEWQGKMPIEFHGVVHDLDGHPVQGATITFTWTNLSPGGSTRRVISSDAAGRFNLNGVKGKFLQVEVSDLGYDSLAGNPNGFEYAAFWDKRFIEPSSAHPIVFTLRKSGAQDLLVHSEREVKISLAVPLKIALGDGLVVTFELVKNSRLPVHSWLMRMFLPEGGLQQTAEEFPFLAPEEGYKSEVAIDERTKKSPNWQSLYEGGVFYVKTPGRYGRVEVQMISGADWMRVKCWQNFTGARGLESNAQK